MAFKKTFVLSDESVNTYNFWVRTEGIKLDNASKNCPAYFNHETWQLPLGHWENLRFENGQLLGDIIIEGGNEDEKNYIRKIENGDIKGASVGIDPLKWITDTMWLKGNGTAPALWDCELFEASLAPLNGNKNALALKSKDGFIRLSEANAGNIIPQIKTDTYMKAIALKLGLLESATENEILAAIGNIQLSNTHAESFRTEVLNGAGVDLKDDAKDIFITLSKTNPAQALKYAASQKETVETVPAKGGVVKDIKLSKLVEDAKKSSANKTADEEAKDCYDYLQKNDAVELGRIKKEEPEKYLQLAADYGNGKRYKDK